MGGIPVIVPIGEIPGGIPHLGHDRQQAAGMKEPGQAIQFVSRPAQVFQGLGGGNEMEGFLKHLLGRSEKGIVILHGHTRLRQHGGQGRAGTRAEIQSLETFGQALEQRIGQTTEKSPILQIAGIILVLQVTLFFRIEIQMGTMRHKNQGASLALKKGPGILRRQLLKVFPVA